MTLLSVMLVKTDKRNGNVAVCSYMQIATFFAQPYAGEICCYGAQGMRSKFCSIACGAKFLFTSANHAMSSLSTYPFPIFFEEWELDVKKITTAWDNKGGIVIGNDVWIGFEAVILSGVTIGDGAIIGTRAVVTKDVPPYTIVGGVPAKPIRKRFSDDVISQLLKIQWWNWPENRIKKNIGAIQSGRMEDLDSTRK